MNARGFQNLADFRFVDFWYSTVPREFRKEILKLCHKDTGLHTGISTSKGKVLRCYFWLNIIRNIQQFANTYDSCQRINKGDNVKKGLLKLVIPEIFT